jgi:hypothetical protein
MPPLDNEQLSASLRGLARRARTLAAKFDVETRHRLERQAVELEHRAAALEAQAGLPMDPAADD